MKKIHFLTFGFLLVFFAVSSVSAAGTITVTAPNGGENWQRGTSQTVTWNYAGDPGSTVKIMLMNASVVVGTINSSVPTGSGGKGSYVWAIPSSRSTGSDYKVSVQSISQPTIKDTSDNFFAITSTPLLPTITVTSPNGGESWHRGTTHMVNWSYTGSPGSTVRITLFKAGAESDPISTSTSIGSGGKGSYSWQINPVGSTGNDYKVEVLSISQPTINDSSNSTFTLTTATTNDVTTQILSIVQDIQTKANSILSALGSLQTDVTTIKTTTNTINHKLDSPQVPIRYEYYSGGIIGRAVNSQNRIEIEVTNMGDSPAEVCVYEYKAAKIWKNNCDTLDSQQWRVDAPIAISPEWENGVLQIRSVKITSNSSFVAPYMKYYDSDMSNDVPARQYFPGDFLKVEIFR